MSGLSVNVNIEDAATKAGLNNLLTSLRNRTPLNREIGRGALELTRDYLTGIGQERHRTAEELGAEPTGFFAKASKRTSMRADDSGATISVNAPGIGRAAHDVDIVPTNGRKFLTIPITAAAYGRTVSQVESTLGIKLFRPVRKGAKASGYSTAKNTWGGVTFSESDKMNVLASAIPGGGLFFAFALVRAVHQQQDRTLLPSDEAYAKTAVASVLAFLEARRAALFGGPSA